MIRSRLLGTLTFSKKERNLKLVPAFVRRETWILWAFVALVAVVSGLFVVVRGLANDVWWDWLTGKWEWSHQAILTKNVFTAHLHGLTWVNTEWAWGLIVYGFSHLGYGGMVGMTMIGIVAFFSLVALFSRWLGTGLLGSLVAVGVAFVASLGWWDFRPQVWAYPMAVGVVWWIFALRARVESGLIRVLVRRWWELLLFSTVILAWASFHGSWILIMGWFGIEAVLASRWSLRVFWSVWLVLLSSWVAWANPWGGVYVFHSLATASSSAISGSIGEWFSPNFHSLPLLALFMLYAFGGSMILLRRGGSASVRSWLYFIGFAAGALYGSRFLPYLGIGFVIAMSGFQSSIRVRPWVGYIASGLVLVSLVVGSVAMPRSSFHGSVAAWGEPVGAVKFLQAHHVVNVFAMDSWGGYFESVGLVPWIDGRADFWLSHGTSFQQYGLARLGAISPVSLVRSSGDKVAAVSPLSSFYWSLKQAGWKVVWRGTLARVLVAPGARLL